MNLRPVSDSDAPEEVRLVFEDAQRLLAVNAIPVMLRFIANAHPYLSYLWDFMREDVVNAQFQELSGKIISFSLSSVSIIYTPSSRAAGFTSSLDETRRKELETLIQQLLRLNSIFFLFSLDLREDLKSAFTQREEVRRLSGVSEALSEQLREGSGRKDAAVTTSRMLAPLFGTSLPILPNVETFFSVVESEMGRLVKTEAYLKTRVELERVSLMYLPSIPHRMNSNYKVFMELIEDKHVAYDLLYLLTHVFPSEFPRLLLTSALMKRLIEGESSLVTQ